MIYNRANKNGQEFIIGETITPGIKIQLVGTSKFIHVQGVSMDEILKGWHQWILNGHYIQNALSMLTNEEREFLISGITPTEWKEMFANEDK
jgi:hypothetical protein